jgi:uncharacterized protein YndB with AHSA1/START domain
MKELTYTITINAPVADVFAALQDKTIYPEWAKAWSDGMTFAGDWSVGSTISFFDTSGQGTKARVNEINAPSTISMTHVAMVENGTDEVTELDETMQNWLGATESYHLTATEDGGTELTVRIVADEAFEPMMQAWDQALQYLREVCESS